MIHSSPPARLNVDDDFVRLLYSEGRLEDTLDLLWNESVILRSPSCSGLGIKRSDGAIHAVRDPNAFSVRGRNAEQKFALQLLMDNEVPIVALGGLAGSGKSMLALAAGLDQVIEQKKYSKVSVFRPLYPVGDQDLGYLPGDFEEKMDPWRQAVWDALGVFCDKTTRDYIINEDLLEVLPLTHLRGRTLEDSFIIIDEAQNLSVSSIITCLTRVGDRSKIALTYDVNQRDNISVGRNDGVLTVVDRLLGEKLFGLVNLHKVERSAVARMVSEKFQDL